MSLRPINSRQDRGTMTSGLSTGFEVYIMEGRKEQMSRLAFPFLILELSLTGSKLGGKQPSGSSSERPVLEGKVGVSQPLC